LRDLNPILRGVYTTAPKKNIYGKLLGRKLSQITPMQSEQVEVNPSAKPPRIDKFGIQEYIKNYDEYLDPLKDKELVLLEIGIAKGDSLYYWRDRFPKAKIVGIDIHSIKLEDSTGRIFTYQGEQQDYEFLDKLAAEVAPQGFDVIIDDGSHIGQYTRLAFWHLYRNHLKPGGLYFIEDWGTGYWTNYPDGRLYYPQPIDFAWHEKILNALAKNSFIKQNTLLKKIVGKLRYTKVKNHFPSHQYGMVGFIKELIDECGAPDITDERFGTKNKRESQIEWMRVSVGHVIVKKPGENLIKN